MADEIIEELWRIKDDLSRESNYNVRQYIENTLKNSPGKDLPHVDLAALKAARAKSDSQKETEKT